MHRRKASKEEDANDTLFPLPPASTSPTDAPAIKVIMNGGSAHASNGVSTNGTSFQFPPPRMRTVSTPGSSGDVSEPAESSPYRQPPPSAGPHRTNFSGSHGPPPVSPTHSGANGLAVPSLASPYTRSFSIPPPLTPNGGSHARTRSVSAYAPAAPSPLSASFSIGPIPSRGHARMQSQSGSGAVNGTGNALLSAPASIVSSSSLPSRLDTNSPSSPGGEGSLPSPGSDGFSPSRSTPFNDFPQQKKSPVAQRVASGRHQRLHSRNLSIFFPRPGSLPTNTIAEDGTQELELGGSVEGKNLGEAPVSLIPSASSAGSINAHPRKLGEGFTFGARPPSSALVDSGDGETDDGPPTQATSRANRRGHHHKHSVSHNFFSFLEPGANARPQDPHQQQQPDELITPHTVETPISSLVPQTPFSAQSHNGSAYPLEKTPSLQHQFVRAPTTSVSASSSSRGRKGKGVSAQEELGGWAASVFQLALGAWVWVSGQSAGSLALTGLGYWVVFDAFGVVLAAALPGYLARRRRRGDTHRKTLGTMYG